MDTILTIKSLDIEQVNANPSQAGNLTSQETCQVILMIRTITQGILATTVKSMYMFLKIA